MSTSERLAVDLSSRKPAQRPASKPTPKEEEVKPEEVDAVLRDILGPTQSKKLGLVEKEEKKNHIPEPEPEQEEDEEEIDFVQGQLIRIYQKAGGEPVLVPYGGPDPKVLEAELAKARALAEAASHPRQREASTCLFCMDLADPAQEWVVSFPLCEHIFHHYCLSISAWGPKRIQDRDRRCPECSSQCQALARWVENRNALLMSLDEQGMEDLEQENLDMWIMIDFLRQNNLWEGKIVEALMKRKSEGGKSLIALLGNPVEDVAPPARSWGRAASRVRRATRRAPPDEDVGWARRVMAKLRVDDLAACEITLDQILDAGFTFPQACYEFKITDLRQLIDLGLNLTHITRMGDHTLYLVKKFDLDIRALRSSIPLKANQLCELSPGQMTALNVETHELLMMGLRKDMIRLFDMTIQEWVDYMAFTKSHIHLLGIHQKDFRSRDILMGWTHVQVMRALNMTEAEAVEAGILVVGQPQGPPSVYYDPTKDQMIISKWTE